MLAIIGSAAEVLQVSEDVCLPPNYELSLDVFIISYPNLAHLASLHETETEAIAMDPCCYYHKFHDICMAAQSHHPCVFPGTRQTLIASV